MATTDNVGLALITTDDAIKLVKDVFDTTSAGAQWLIGQINSLYNSEVYHGDLGILPAGHKMDFWLGDCDDQATISYAGLVRTFNRQESDLPYKNTEQVVLKGKHNICLKIVNSGGNTWEAGFSVFVEGHGEIINANPSGNDYLTLGKQRFYIWSFTGA